MTVIFVTAISKLNFELKARLKKKNKMEKVYLQIRKGEGGKDSALLVEDMADMYIRSAKVNNFNYSVIQNKDGMVVL